MNLDKDSDVHIAFDIPVEETYGIIRQKRYVVSTSGKVSNVKDVESGSHQSIKSFFMNAFLPYGFPHTVSDDYLEYQVYDTIQAFASSITGSVCTHSILKGVGVGDASASALAASITWLYKDGVSMIGRIVFAWLQGTSLDTDCKKWRLFADILNDLAMLLDLLSPYFRDYFTFIICISGAMKSIVGVAGGCTRAAITQHQAIKNNMADVSAKDGSQETLVNFVALLASLVILPIVSDSLMLTWFLYFMMTLVHLTANYLAVKSVVMKTFNEARFKIYANDYLDKAFKIAIGDNNQLTLLNVLEVNKRESVFFDYSQEQVKIKLGVSFEDVICGKESEEVVEMCKLYKEANYWLSVHAKSSSSVLVLVTLRKNVTSKDLMEAFFQALVFKKFMDLTPCDMLDNRCNKSLENQSRRYTLKHFGVFLRTLERFGFNTEAVSFQIDLWRAEW